MRKSYITIAGSKFSFEEILLIALHYNANGDMYSSMVYVFGDNWNLYTYPINFFPPSFSRNIIIVSVAGRFDIGQRREKSILFERVSGEMHVLTRTEIRMFRFH